MAVGLSLPCQWSVTTLGRDTPAHELLTAAMSFTLSAAQFCSRIPKLGQLGLKNLAVTLGSVTIFTVCFFTYVISNKSFNMELVNLKIHHWGEAKVERN